MNLFAKACAFAMNRARAAARDESGATAIEYALIAALICIVIIAAMNAIGTNLGTTWNTIASKMK